MNNTNLNELSRPRQCPGGSSELSSIDPQNGQTLKMYSHFLPAGAKYANGFHLRFFTITEIALSPTLSGIISCLDGIFVVWKQQNHNSEHSRREKYKTEFHNTEWQHSLTNIHYYSLHLYSQAHLCPQEKAYFSKKQSHTTSTNSSGMSQTRRPADPSSTDSLMT